MRRIPHHRPFVGVAVVLAMSVPSGSRAQSLESFEQRVTDKQLDNGLTIILVERATAPVISITTHLDVGAVNEHVGITGVAHVFEHMAFKGTEKVGAVNYQREARLLADVDRAWQALRRERLRRAMLTGDEPDPGIAIEALEARFAKAQAEAEKLVRKNEFDSALQVAGAVGLNASTSADATKYVVSLPANALELWAYLESERFREPVLREFYKERDVVMEERRRSESNPIQRLIEEFLAVAYKAHPYGQPVLGHMSDLANLSRDDAKSFFKRHYTPQATTIAIVGDVERDSALKLVERYFGRLKRGPEPEPVATIEPPQLGEKRVTVEDPSQPLYVIGYHKPASTHPDEASYDVITDLIGTGRTSRLYQRLVKQEQVAVDTGAFPGFPGQKYPNLFIFYAFPSAGRTTLEVATLIDEEIERLRTEPVSQADLEAVKTRARAALLRQLESNAGMASALTDYQVLTGDWRNLFRHVEAIGAVTPESVQGVARRTFVRTNRIVGEIVTAARNGAD